MFFLLRRAKVLSPVEAQQQPLTFAARSPAEYTAAEAVVTLLGGLPLALDQAAAYIDETRCGFSGYLQRYEQQRSQVLDRRGALSTDHPQSVVSTFLLACQQVTQRNPAALELLQFCAWLSPDAIPEELLLAHPTCLGPVLGPVAADPFQFDQALGVLLSLSLVYRHPETRMLSMHRLMQAVLLDSMTDAEREQWTRRVIEALEAVFPEIRPVTEYSTWKQSERLLPHALLCVHRAEAQEASLPLASLAYKAAQYLRERSWYAEAEPLYQRALHIREQILGPEHPDVATLLNYLAAIYYEQSKYAEAERLVQRVLRIREQALGTVHPDVARALNNLAMIYRVQSKYPEAERLSQQALHILEQALGPEHLSVANLLHNLGVIYRIQARYGEAEALYRRALHIREQIQGADHPQMASAFYNLANLFRDQGKYTEAEALYRRALHIWEQALGPEHPDVALVLNNLAELYRVQGKYPEAQPLYQHALHIWEQSLGPTHPDVARALHGLANLSRGQSQDGEAEVFYQRALAIREQHLDAYHPDIAETLHDLALLRKTQGNLDEAISLAERALKSRVQSLGDAHPKTLATRTLYAQLVQEQAGAEVETASRRRPEAIPNPRGNKRHQNGASSPLHKAVTLDSSANNPLQEFLDACCELHPLAWCRSADLWQAYQQWVEAHQERYPLSRGAFIAQLKTHGCRSDRTKTARIWRGIALVKTGNGGR